MVVVVVVLDGVGTRSGSGRCGSRRRRRSIRGGSRRHRGRGMQCAMAIIVDTMVVMVVVSSVAT